jgi:DNA-directed RNA polymerase subunit omega
MIKKPKHRTELEITTEECTKVIENKYEMILMASARARELERGARPMVEGDNKNCVTAMKEIAAGLVDRDIITRVKK